MYCHVIRKQWRFRQDNLFKEIKKIKILLGINLEDTNQPHPRTGVPTQPFYPPSRHKTLKHLHRERRVQDR